MTAALETGRRIGGAIGVGVGGESSMSPSGSLAMVISSSSLTVLRGVCCLSSVVCDEVRDNVFYEKSSAKSNISMPTFEKALKTYNVQIFILTSVLFFEYFFE